MTRIIEIPNLDDLLRRYEAGESELKLSREFGVDRGVIRRRLLKAGITPRNGSQAMTIRMGQMSNAERLAITAHAHEAARGRHQTISERVKRANTREVKGMGISTTESIFKHLLETRGIYNVTPQKAIGTYNVDIAIESPRIAIEIFGGSWHNCEHHRRLHHKRIPYILNSGWSVVIIWVDARRYPLTVGASDYVTSLVEHLRSDKPVRSEYHVIRGTGELVPILSSEFNCQSIINRPRTRDSKGRYQSVVW